MNKDQLEILAALRESVNEDKTGLEGEVTKLQSQIQELKEKNKMQLEQVNTLLMEKVSLQSDGLTQRERMLERERDFTYVLFLARRSLCDYSISWIVDISALLMPARRFPKS